MLKWNLPLTYEPKIQPVIDGKIRQTLRVLKEENVFRLLHEKRVGDLIRFYTWSGKPYRSKRTTITEYTPLTEVWNIKIEVYGIRTSCFGASSNTLYEWKGVRMGWLAELDGIVPATGFALRDVLMSKNKIPKEGVDAQILRW